MILLDTDICIELLRGNAKVIEKRQGYDEKVAISFMSVAELFYGAENRRFENRKLDLITLAKSICRI